MGAPAPAVTPGRALGLPPPRAPAATGPAAPIWIQPRARRTEQTLRERLRGEPGGAALSPRCPRRVLPTPGPALCSGKGTAARSRWPGRPRSPSAGLFLSFPPPGAAPWVSSRCCSVSIKPGWEQRQRGARCGCPGAGGRWRSCATRRGRFRAPGLRAKLRGCSGESPAPQRHNRTRLRTERDRDRTAPARCGPGAASSAPSPGGALGAHPPPRAGAATRLQQGPGPRKNRPAPSQTPSLAQGPCRGSPGFPAAPAPGLFALQTRSQGALCALCALCPVLAAPKGSCPKGTGEGGGCVAGTQRLVPPVTVVPGLPAPWGHAGREVAVWGHPLWGAPS